LAGGAQEIPVIFQQFFEAGAGDIGELDLGFLGCAAGAAAFEDVLFAGAGGLDHLVGGAAALVHEMGAKAGGGIEDDAGFAEGEQVLVAAMRREEAFRGRTGRRRRTIGVGRVGRVGPVGGWHGARHSDSTGKSKNSCGK
jgi:hypothetical protein